jgi:hypothetical protein
MAYPTNCDQLQFDLILSSLIMLLTSKRIHPATYVSHIFVANPKLLEKPNSLIVLSLDLPHTSGDGRVSSLFSPRILV